MKKAALILFSLVLSVAAQANTVTVTSTAIIDNFQKACGSKGNDTQALITSAERAVPAINGLISQNSIVNSTTEEVPPSTHYDGCAYFVYQCGGYYPGPYPGFGHHGYPGYYPGYGAGCGNYCEGGFVTDPGYTISHDRCDTTLTLDSKQYVLNLYQGTYNPTAELNAALAKGNVVYDEIDHGKARWVAIDPISAANPTPAPTAATR
jgi:hypothetical protein